MIVIASVGESKNKNIYSVASIESLARQLPGLRVLDYSDDPESDGPKLGEVTVADVSEGSLSVAVKWLGVAPVGRFL